MAPPGAETLRLCEVDFSIFTWWLRPPPVFHLRFTISSINCLTVLLISLRLRQLVNKRLWADTTANLRIWNVIMAKLAHLPIVPIIAANQLKVFQMVSHGIASDTASYAAVSNPCSVYDGPKLCLTPHPPSPLQRPSRRLTMPVCVVWVLPQRRLW